MKFRKHKKPKPIMMALNTSTLHVSNTGLAKFNFGYEEIGPRKAIEIARWLTRYAKWSSLDK